MENIDWKSLGVFDAEDLSTLRSMAKIFYFTMSFFVIFYFANKMFFAKVMLKISGPESPYFKLNERDLR